MFRLRVLGGFALDGDSGASAPALPKRRAEAVLAVLAVCGDLGCTRERLLALLWPESDEASARHGLRDALHAIRRALGSGAVPSAGRLLRLDPAVVASDAISFSQALASDRPADAVRLYAGPLLAGFHVDDAAEFERWLDGERARLAREYGEALKQLATAAEGAGAWGEAVRWWARAVEHDPVNSHLVLQQVRLLAGIGDRANAIKVAEGHARRLREEFDLEPDREILATIERIRRGELPSLQGGLPASAPTPATELPAVAEETPRPIAAAAKRAPRWVPWAAVVAALTLGGAFAAGRLPGVRAEAGDSRTAIAVLPFRSLSADSSFAYFADGLHDELLTQLAKVASLRVIGRTSVQGYEATSKPLRQIAEELEVGSVVEASVQVVGNRLRVTVQLVDPVSQAQLWSERYDRTLDDAFAVQSDIAQRIVAAVGGTLTNDEAGAIAAAPTQNAGAYDYYLQGLEYHRRAGFLRENLVAAQRLYERALALDSSFALAHAALATIHVTMHMFGYDQSDSRLKLAQREAQTGLGLKPGLSKAYLAAGVGEHLGGRHRDALNKLSLAVRGAPNDPELWASIGTVHQSLGNWDSALMAFEHAQRLDPRDANLSHKIGDALHYVRRYPEAIAAYRHAAAFAPDLVQPRLSLAWSYFLWKGELDTLRAVLRGLPLDGDPGGGGGSFGEQRLVVLLWERRPDSLLALLRDMGPAAATAVRTFSSRALFAADAHTLRGDTAAARVAFDSAAALLTVEERTRSDDFIVHAARGMALAGLGRRSEALSEVRWLERYDARRRDRYESGPAYSRARILTRLGETDAAMALIDRLLVGPSLFSVHELRVNPDFDPIRSDPRYQALLEKSPRAALFSSPR